VDFPFGLTTICLETLTPSFQFLGPAVPPSPSSLSVPPPPSVPRGPVPRAYRDLTTNFCPGRRNRLRKVVPNYFEEAQTTLSKVKKYANDIILTFAPNTQAYFTYEALTSKEARILGTGRLFKGD
jgi:hypothetical protein